MSAIQRNVLGRDVQRGDVQSPTKSALVDRRHGLTFPWVAWLLSCRCK